MKIVKLEDQMLALVGAATPEEFPAKLTAFVSTATHISKEFMAEKKELQDFEARISALEAKPQLTEARVGEILGASVSKAVTDFASSDAGRKVIGAEASRITMEALASVGTQPVKGSAAPAEPAANTATGLIAAGKFEEAFAASKELQAEFPSAKHFTSYARAEAAGRINFAKVQRNSKN